jgi:hypothetical protein
MPSRTKCFEDPADDFSFDSHWFCRWTLPVYSTLLSPNRPFPKLTPFRGLFAFQPNHFKNVLRFLRLPEHRGDYPFCPNSNPSVVQAREPGWFASSFN